MNRLSLFLICFSAFAETIVEPTPPSKDEMVAFQGVYIRYLQARVQVLEDLANDKLGLAVQKEATESKRALDGALVALQEKHDAKGCVLTVDAKWECGKKKGEN